MAKFYFDVFDAAGCHVDDFGGDYPDMAAAREDAIAIAKQVMLESRAGEIPVDVSVTLRTDGSGERHTYRLWLMEVHDEGAVEHRRSTRQAPQ